MIREIVNCEMQKSEIDTDQNIKMRKTREAGRR